MAETTKNAEDKLREAIKTRLETALQVSQRVVPVESGELQNSLQIQEDDQGNIVLGSDVEYAPYVEFETVDTPAQPFIRPGMEAAKRENNNF